MYLKYKSSDTEEFSRYFWNLSVLKNGPLPFISDIFEDNLN